MDLDGAAQARLASPEPRLLTIAELTVGTFGVLVAEVRHLHAVKTFQRKDGSDGCLRRVTLGDATGEVDVVLWGDDALGETFPPRGNVMIRGPTVKAGWQGGIELGIGGATIETIPEIQETRTGILTALAETELIGDPPDVRFRAMARLSQDGAEMAIVLWDEAVREAIAAGVGARVHLEGRPHAVLDDTFEADRLRAQP